AGGERPGDRMRAVRARRAAVTNARRHAGDGPFTPADCPAGDPRRLAQGRPRSGADRFREVSWDEALDLVAGELTRVRGTYGDTAIFGGSYGWSSAGRLHHARTLVRRFLFLGGGCVDQIGNYSWGAAQFLLPM